MIGAATKRKEDSTPACNNNKYTELYICERNSTRKNTRKKIKERVIYELNKANRSQLNKDKQQIIQTNREKAKQ